MAVKSKRTKSALGGRPNRPVKHEPSKMHTEDAPLVDREETTDIIFDGEISDDIRETIRGALKDSAKNISKWLADVGAENPARALAIYKDLTEYVVPRMQRTDSKIDPTSPVQVIFETSSTYDERKKAEAIAAAQKHEETEPPKKINKNDGIFY